MSRNFKRIAGSDRQRERERERERVIRLKRFGVRRKESLNFSFCRGHDRVAGVYTRVANTSKLASWVNHPRVYSCSESADTLVSVACKNSDDSGRGGIKTRISARSPLIHATIYSSVLLAVPIRFLLSLFSPSRFLPFLAVSLTHFLLLIPPAPAPSCKFMLIFLYAE